MTGRELRALCTLIARDLMTNGNGDRADRLVLTASDGEGRPGRDLGGWSEGPLVDRLVEQLRPYLVRGKATP